MEYVIPGGLFVLMIGSLIAVKIELANRPTFDHTDEKYKNKEVCDAIHKSVDEKLSCIPEIKETVIEIRTILKERAKNE
ncbi:hypothetical protein LCGC14_1755720 [marine sediment metagenome]|uniref:Uncharacterized protein n=1 Tax=marine sediment metagenome TaxID=412755 RepID=A0A0F9JHS1_9ZZZZ